MFIACHCSTLLHLSTFQSSSPIILFKTEILFKVSYLPPYTFPSIVSELSLLFVVFRFLRSTRGSFGTYSSVRLLLLLNNQRKTKTGKYHKRNPIYLFCLITTTKILLLLFLIDFFRNIFSIIEFFCSECIYCLGLSAPHIEKIICKMTRLVWASTFRKYNFLTFQR